MFFIKTASKSENVSNHESEKSSILEVKIYLHIYKIENPIFNRKGSTGRITTGRNKGRK